jgi:hypothetical protein
MRQLSFGGGRRSSTDRARAHRFVGVGAGNRRAAAAAAALACLFVCAATAAPAGAESSISTYAATETVPVPPASHFAGAGDGDGWAVALSDTAVYNVFHHQDFLGVSCHLQANAEGCWSGRTFDTITEPGGDGFATSGQPGLHLDPHTGKLYVYATRIDAIDPADDTAGVVCVDTTQPASNEDPFCGFTELTKEGEGQLVGGISGTSDPMLIGTHFYAFSYQDDVGQEGTKNTLLCFDVSTGAACTGQPYDVALETGKVTDGGFPSPATAVIAGKAIIPISIENTSYLTCFDDATQSTCSGKWPVKLAFGYASENGAPFPLLSATGTITGLCLPTGTDQCYTLEGEATTTPAGMTSVIEASTPWNGPAFVLGPRIYVPNGNTNGDSGEVECFDYSTGAGCENFPKTFPGLYYLYTVNPDPQRPSCIWVNSDADDGTLPLQITSFDAYTGQACGEGTVRVLASQFVVPQPQCMPATYVSMQVLQPARETYTSGSIAFADGDGNLIPGLPEVQLDGTGTASLAGLELNTPTGLPQFLFTLNGNKGKVGSIEVKLTWTASYDPSCIGEKTTVTVPPTPTPAAPVVAPVATPAAAAPKTTAPAPKSAVKPFDAAHLASSAPNACLASGTYVAAVAGSSIASVTFTVNGHEVTKLEKPNSHGKFTAPIKLPAGQTEKLVVHVAYTKASGKPAATLKRTLARCAVHHKPKPHFTG